MAKEYRISNLSTGWKLPFNFAVLFHIFLLSSAIVLPKYINNRPRIPEFTSVDLINIAEILPLPEASARQVTPPVKTVEPPPAKAAKPKPVEARKVAPIAPVAPVTPEVVQGPPKAISLKPLKRKLKKKLPPKARTQESVKKQDAEKKRESLARQQALDAQSRELQAEASRQQAIADTEAKIAASEALNALKRSLRADAASTATKNGQRRATRSGGSSSVLKARYNASLANHLHQFWSLPEIKQWDPQLTARVIIRISQNGKIVSHNFEKRSGDRVFDQFVSRTIQEANPLPAIPAALKEHEYTLGLRFSPGGIQ